MSAAGLSSRPEADRLIASLPFAVVVIAPDAKIAAVNPAAEQILGQGAARLIGVALETILALEEAHLAARLEEGETQLFARGARVRIGRHQRRLDLMLAPVVGHPGWRMVVLHETLDVAALGEEGDAPLRAPEILAHEIKNPLAGIRGAAQLLGRDGDERQRGLTSLITAEVDRVTQLIDQMQVLSRKSAAPARPCNVHEALRQAVAVLEAAGESVLPIEEAFDPSLPPVLCSPDALVQVVLNLLDNARAAGAQAEAPQIVISTRFASGIRVRESVGKSPLSLPIEIRVSDNGPGIAAEVHDHIFEPFVSSKPRGQGLGLALVQKLVREMRGRVTFDRDEAGGWTHFRVHLPVAERGEGSIAKAAAA